jgi:hypothetical protein
MNMDFGTLKWRWLINMSQMEGSYPRLINQTRTLWVTWKPIGWWYQPGGPKDYRPVKDSFINNPPSKAEHKWTQASTWAEYCLQFVREGGAVLDPMCGTCVSGVAAVKSGHPFVGIDIDPEQVERSNKHMEELLKEAVRP